MADDVLLDDAPTLLDSILVEVDGPLAEILLLLEKTVYTRVGGLSETDLVSRLNFSKRYLRTCLKWIASNFRSVEIEVYNESTGDKITNALDVDNGEPYFDWESKTALTDLDNANCDLFYKAIYAKLDGALIPVSNNATFEERIEVIKEVPVEVIKEVEKEILVEKAVPIPVTVGQTSKFSPPKKIPEGKRKKPAETAADKRALIRWSPFPSVPDPIPNFQEPPWYEDLRAALDMGENVALIGPIGIGKSTSVMQLAYELSTPVAVVGGSGGIRDRHLTGSPLVEEATSLFLVNDFGTVVCHGGMGFITEVNGIDPDAAMILNGIIAAPYQIQLRGRGYEKSPEFRLVVDLNRNVKGTKVIAESLMDRFTPIEIDYPDERFFARLLIANGAGSLSLCHKLYCVAKTFWDDYENNALNYQFSPRRLYSALKRVDDATSDHKLSQVLNRLIAPMAQLQTDRRRVPELIDTGLATHQHTWPNSQLNTEEVRQWVKEIQGETDE